MAFDRTRTVRGALAGSIGAAVWLASQPLDQRLFGVEYDDAELLGRLVARGRPEAQAVGAALHIQNGALFGALYAQVAPSLPVHPALRGPLTALLEHLATWPAIALVEPSLLRNGRAFAMSAWRHLLFGAVARRAGAAAEPARRRARAGRRGGGRLERPRLRGAPGRERSALTRVLITGASGFSGRHLVAACESAGDDVVRVGRAVADLRDAGATRARHRRRAARGRLPPRRARPRRRVVAATPPGRCTTTWR